MVINIKENKVLLNGVNDPHIMFDNFKEVGFQNVDLKIGIIHAPYKKTIEQFADYDIIFCGHTHGGQINLPNKKALVTNCDIKPKYAYGLFNASEILNNKSAKAYVNISKGLGTSKSAKVRLFCKPSATVITVK